MTATPCYTTAIEPVVSPSRPRRGASVTPLHPHLVTSSAPTPRATSAVPAARARRAPARRGWTLLLVPPARLPGAVRTVPLRRRHALPPLAGIALLLGAVAYGAARLGARAYEASLAPELAAVHERLHLGEERLRLLDDSLGILRAQVAALSAARDAARTSTTSGAAGRRTATGSRGRAAGVVLPVDGRITSAFATGRLHPILHIRRAHRGLDIAAPAGTPILAPAAGHVASVRRELGYGLVVRIDHGGGTTTRYAHLRSALVKPGQAVTAGMAIGTVGSSGLATGPHLHYEVRVRGTAKDPLRTPVHSSG
ncbi:MAG TPA: M23 family metallopeptidase [Gemmatimonadaceae bacterium]|nr:M23 family metallopeptidase [Gemmatimonadaceae bacterium]